MDENPAGNRFLEKIKRDPVVPLGIVGLVATAIIGIRNYKHSKQNVTVYFGSLRVLAQGAVVGSLGLVVVVNFFKAHILPSSDEEKK